jgi:hypothetical protein
MSAIVRRVAGFVVVGLALGWTAPARAAETIALAPLELAGGLEVSRVDLEAAVVKGLAVAGRPVLLPVEDQRAATYTVSARIGRVDASFEVRMRLQRVADGYAMNVQENHCDVTDCSVAELARRSARELVRQALGRSGEAPIPAPAAAVEAAPDSSPRSFPALGAVTTGAGAAAIAAGIYLLAVDGKCTSSTPNHTCKNLYDTKAWGIGSLAGGAVLGGLGIYLMIHDGKRDGATVAIGVRRAGLVATGRF